MKPFFEKKIKEEEYEEKKHINQNILYIKKLNFVLNLNKNYQKGKKKKKKKKIIQQKKVMKRQKKKKREKIKKEIENIINIFSNNINPIESFSKSYALKIIYNMIHQEKKKKQKTTKVKMKKMKKKKIKMSN